LRSHSAAAARLHGRNSGRDIGRERLPLVLRSRVTPAGERLTLGLFPGQSAELPDARVEELRAAAHARDVTVTRDPGR
jgi:hypothetical protein